MGTYHYVACHDCKKSGMLPKSSNPEVFAEEWKNKFGHADHDTEFASEYDEEFEARVQGREVIGYSPYYYEPITKQVNVPYENVTKETLS